MSGQAYLYISRSVSPTMTYNWYGNTISDFSHVTEFLAYTFSATSYSNYYVLGVYKKITTMSQRSVSSECYSFVTPFIDGQQPTYLPSIGKSDTITVTDSTHEYTFSFPPSTTAFLTAGNKYWMIISRSITPGYSFRIEYSTSAENNFKTYEDGVWVDHSGSLIGARIDQILINTCSSYENQEFVKFDVVNVEKTKENLISVLNIPNQTSAIQFGGVTPAEFAVNGKIHGGFDIVNQKEDGFKSLSSDGGPFTFSTDVCTYTVQINNVSIDRSKKGKTVPLSLELTEIV